MRNPNKWIWLPVSLMIFSMPVMARYYQATQGSMAVADRAGGTVSVIDVNTDTVKHTIRLPKADDEATPEPMYVVYKKNLLYVGDRANNQVLVFDSHAYQLIKKIPVGRGVFHMWASKYAELLLVVNDVDNSISVIDTNNLTVKTTVAIPQDLVNAGFKPHDVFISANGRQWFVSLLGNTDQGWILKYQYWWGRAYQTARRQVGGDPHLFLVKRDRSLLVASQDEGTVTELSSRHLGMRRQANVPNAHGIFAHYNRVYVTDIADGGTNGLYTLNRRHLRSRFTNDTPQPTPHNISVTRNGKKLYITHSGASQDKVSVFDTHAPWRQPNLKTTVTVGTNPFGLAYVPH